MPDIQTDQIIFTDYSDGRTKVAKITTVEFAGTFHIYEMGTPVESVNTIKYFSDIKQAWNVTFNFGRFGAYAGGLFSQSPAPGTTGVPHPDVIIRTRVEGVVWQYDLYDSLNNQFRNGSLTSSPG
jgi:hypothetical protein